MTITVSDPFDPSPVDTAAGFRYAFACEGGALDGATYATSTPDPTITCTYPDGPSTHTVRARIIDKDDGFTDYTSEVTVLNVASTVEAGPDLTVNEGESFVGTGSFSDPGAFDTHTATVDYGDGSGVQPLPLTADQTFSLSHTYLDDGLYPVWNRHPGGGGG